MTKEELYDLVWSQPMTKLAGSLRLSDVGLRKKCKKLNIPLPPQGYILRSPNRQQGQRPPLPPFDGNNAIEFTTDKETKSSAREMAQEVKTQIEFESLGENRIKVLSKLFNPHLLVQQFKESLSNLSYYETGRGEIISKGGELLDISASPASMDRALRIMDSLLRALEKRDYKITITPKDSNPRAFVTRVSVLGESLAFRLRESYTQKKHEPLQGNKKKAKPISFSSPVYDYIPSGVLSLCIEEFVG